MSVLNAPAAIAHGGRERSARGRRALDRAFLWFCISVTAMACLVLSVLLIAIITQGWSHLNWKFLSSYPSMDPAKAGFKASLWGSVWVCGVCALVAVPLGIGTAVFLEEYKPKSRFLLRLHGFVQLNIANLAGVPSVVYGIIGLTAFARMFGMFGPASLSNYDELIRLDTRTAGVVQGLPLGEDDQSIVVDDVVHGEMSVDVKDVVSRKDLHAQRHELELKDGSVVAGRLASSTPKSLKIFTVETGAVEVLRADVNAWRPQLMHEMGNKETPFYARVPFGGGVLAAGLTLMLVVLPVVIVSTREALRSVPPSLREGALALGATRWQMVSGMILPASVPGIMTGAILAMSRAIGEAAPVLVVSGVVFIMNTPRNLMSDFSAMPLQIYDWVGRPQEEFKQVAAAGIIVLLGVLIVFNALAVFVRQRMQRGLNA